MRPRLYILEYYDEVTYLIWYPNNGTAELYKEISMSWEASKCTGERLKQVIETFTGHEFVCEL